ncbi:hypothetical protein DH2020_000636 [Rehmannia glutinosa]|uniref:Non-specific serine/threonine protein kinase n=1 Tax=Rehmannia glutinosa TaxID=99300 RepID=A0ABR0XX53_REHGL
MWLSGLSQLLSGLSVKNFIGKSLTKCCLTRYFCVPLMLLVLFSVFSVVFCDDFTMASVPLGFEVNAFDRDKNWVSKNGVFAFGFLEIDGDDVDEYVVGVKYNLGDKFANLPVWTVGGVLGDKDEVVWESFGSPTNTLLPGQSLHYSQNLRASSTRSVSSYYNLVISKIGELELVWEHNVTYWRSHFSSNEARFDSDGVFGLYDDHNNVVWSVSSKDYGDPSVNLRHLRIDRDGNLRIYSWDDASRISSSGVDSGVVGCKKMVDLVNCKMHTSIVAMKQTVLYGLYPSHDVEMLLSETACKEYCSNDTNCIAATSMNDGSGRCTIKRTTFVSGYKNPYIRAVSFLKVCSVPQAAAAQGANTHGNAETISSSNGLNGERVSSKKLIGAIGLIVLLTVLVILSIQILVFSLLYHRRKIKVRTRIPFGKDAQMNPHYSVLIRLSFEEIKELTNDFANQIGTSVFKGVLPNKTPIVANRKKVLKDVAASEKEFRVTVSTLSGTHHRNLVSVKGFCFEPANKFLLYEYVKNGSLDKWLFNLKEDHNESIWQQKLDIALGVARGLAYLHSECQKCITHGNLKLENVLLDENLVPKLTDFGLQDFLTKQTASSSSESLSERDVYMLGQMLLQIVTCKKEVVGETIQTILDKVNGEHKFVGGDSLDAIERIARISFWCMQNQPFLRPSIGEVVKVLEGTLSVDRPPPSCLAPRHENRINTTEIEGEC